MPNEKNVGNTEIGNPSHKDARTTRASYEVRRMGCDGEWRPQPEKPCFATNLGF
jgi:hypothetical protein